VIVTYQGHDYTFDQDAITVDEWRELKRKLKMTPGQWQAGLDEADPDTFTFLYWLLIKHDGQPGAVLGDGLKFNLIELNNAIGTAAEQEDRERKAAEQAELEAAAAKAAELGPTQPGAAPSAEPASLTATTLTPSQPGTITASTGSSTPISSSSGASTSSPSPTSATSPIPPSGG
jgi:hypothetical protein